MGGRCGGADLHVVHYVLLPFILQSAEPPPRDAVQNKWTDHGLGKVVIYPTRSVLAFPPKNNMPNGLFFNDAVALAQFPR
jgi:hypothetical protein